MRKQQSQVFLFDVGEGNERYCKSLTQVFFMVVKIRNKTIDEFNKNESILFNTGCGFSIDNERETFERIHCNVQYPSEVLQTMFSFSYN